MRQYCGSEVGRRGQRPGVPRVSPPDHATRGLAHLGVGIQPLEEERVVEQLEADLGHAHLDQRRAERRQPRVLRGVAQPARQHQRPHVHPRRRQLRVLRAPAHLRSVGPAVNQPVCRFVVPRDAPAATRSRPGPGTAPRRRDGECLDGARPRKAADLAGGPGEGRGWGGAEGRTRALPASSRRAVVPAPLPVMLSITTSSSSAGSTTPPPAGRARLAPVAGAPAARRRAWRCSRSPSATSAAPARSATAASAGGDVMPGARRAGATAGRCAERCGDRQGWNRCPGHRFGEKAPFSEWPSLV